MGDWQRESSRASYPVAVFDIGALEFIVLGIAALFIFGPDRLPGMAKQAGRGLRQLRDMAMNARRDLSRELGPEFEDFDLRDLNPKQFVQKHVLDDIDEDDVRLDSDLDVSKDLRVDIDDKPSRSSRTNGTTKSSRTSTRTKQANGTDTANGTDADTKTDVTAEDGEPVGESASVPAGDAAQPEAPRFDPDAT